MDTYIRAHSIGLDLPVFTQNQRSVRATLGLFFRAALQPPKRELRTTLDSISFALEPGDRLGIVGRNGAGKSTLLKVLVGAYAPSRGQLDVSGNRQALLNLSLGFNQEATIVENIMLRGIAMGLRPQQASAVIDEVLDFSELRGKSGDRLRTLSAGQRMRLGFALATSIQNEILIMDEWIGAGDAGFVEKAKERIRSRVDNAQIVVLASHNFRLMRSVCNKGILLEEGKVMHAGSMVETLKAFDDLLKEASQKPGGDR